MTDTGHKRNGRSFTRIAIVALAMFGFGYLLVPLYDVFCEITGLNGKTGRIDEAAIAKRYEPDMSRMVTVQFVANNNIGMPWEFGPVVASMQVHPGKVYQTSFTARNPTARNMIGQAVPSVAPGKASRYFNKTECFCFTRQVFEAGEGRDMPLAFMVDPDLPEDVGTLTLSYTFFNIDEGSS